jgi:hypothetical protein
MPGLENRGGHVIEGGPKRVALRAARDLRVEASRCGRARRGRGGGGQFFGPPLIGECSAVRFCSH